MRYDVVLFDLDGTLTQSDLGIVRCVQYAAEKLGMEPPSDAQARRFIGPPLHHSFCTMLGLAEEKASIATEIYRERYDAVGWKENEVYTGVPTLLRTLKAQGVRIALATGKPANFAKRILAHYGLADFFDAQIGTRQEDKHPEKAALVKEALAAVGYKAGERAVMVGDRLFDVEGARANGIDSIGVCYGYGTREELEKAGATCVVDDMDALHAMLCGDAPKRGVFLTIEGLDGSGKTSQIRILTKYLQERGYDVLHTREPGGTAVGEVIRDLVLDPKYPEMVPLTEALLYAAQRAQHVSEVIKPALKAGKLVLGDRYVDASVAFQGGGRQLGVAEVLAMNEPAIQGLLPDATLLFRVDTQTAMARRSGERALDRIEKEKEAFHQRVHEAYDALCARWPERIVQVDASESIEKTSEAACRAIDAVLRRI